MHISLSYSNFYLTPILLTISKRGDQLFPIAEVNESKDDIKVLQLHLSLLIHWGRDKMAAILQRTCSICIFLKEKFCILG